MEKFSCTDVHLGCDAVFTADSPEQVLRQVTRHAWQCHELHLPALPAATVGLVLAAMHRVLDTRATPPTRANSPIRATRVPDESSVVLPGPALLDVVRIEAVGPRSAALRTA